MRNIRSKRQSKKGVISRRNNSRKMVKYFLVAFVLYLLFNFGQGFYKAYHLKKDGKTLHKELEILQQENIELQKEYEFIQSKEAVEKIAREKLGLIKPGEMIILKAQEVVQ